MPPVSCYNQCPPSCVLIIIITAVHVLNVYEFDVVTYLTHLKGL